MTRRARASAGEGSIYYSPSKNCWRIRLSITGPDGKRRQPSIGQYATREEAVAAHRATRAAPVSDWTTMTWEEWLAIDIPRFLAHLRRLERRSYARIIDRYFRVHLTHRLVRLGRMADTTPAQLDRLWDDLLQTNARSTTKKMKSAVSSSFIRAQAEGLLLRNPVPLSTVAGDDAKDPDVRPVEYDEVLSLDEYVALRERLIHLIEHGPTNDTRATHWALPAIVLGETGARRAEALGLQARDLRPDRRLRIERQVLAEEDEDAPAGLSVRKLVLGPPKTAASYRTISMGDLLHDLLTRHVQRADLTGREMLFTNPASGGYLHPDAFTTWLQRQMKLAGIDRSCGPHTLRHTHVTLLLANSSPDTLVSQRLGHDNSAFTRKQYVRFLHENDGIGQDWDDITRSRQPPAQRGRS